MTLIRITAAVASTLTSTLMAGTPVHLEVAKLTARDGDDSAYFGSALAFAPGLLVVGARLDDGTAPNTGSIYLFDNATGRQTAKLHALDASVGDYLGWSVGANESLVIGGAPDDDDFGDSTGAAYLFDPTAGMQIAKLVAADGIAGDRFGFSVALSQTLAVVGAPGRDDLGNWSGALYVYDLATRRQLHKLLPDAKDAADHVLGINVAIDGSLILAGAKGDSEQALYAGAAYLFDAVTGTILHKLVASDGADFHELGDAVAVGGGLALVGASRASFNGPDSGAAYLFDVATGEQLLRLLPNDPEAYDRFGSSVALSSDRALVGAFRHDEPDPDWGRVYVFDTTTGQQLATLQPSDGEIDDWFGWAVAMDGQLAAVTSLLDDDMGSSSGSVYLFDFSNPSCPADIDGDGEVSGSDLGLLLGAWCPTGFDCTPAADLNDDGSVDGADLGLLLATFGRCPD